MHRLNGLALVASAALFLLPGLAAAQDSLQVCSGVGIQGPAEGSVIGVAAGYRANISWNSEPEGAVSSEVASVQLNANGDGTFTMGDGKRSAVAHGKRRGMGSNQPGTHSWSVIFYDAGGQPICMTQTQTYVVPAESGSTPDVPVTTQAANPTAAAAAVQVALGRYVIRLGSDNTIYTGAADRTISGDNYDDTADADDWRARGYAGLEIYGNQRNNVIVGSDLADLIYGGDESCTGDLCNYNYKHLGDTIDGGAGDDEIYGGAESCNGDACNHYHSQLGDIIHGGAGDDTIHGGDESCVGPYDCTSVGSMTGDTIFGDDGNDIIIAGDNSCLGNGCSAMSNLGDTIDGGAGDDTIDGGSESCDATNCTYNGSLGDILTPSTGSDAVTNVP